MNRFRAALLSLAALAAGCNQTTATTVGDLSAPQGVTAVGEELFIASTRTDELRVLKLATDAATRDFVRAPNPLYVLSVPVSPRPTRLVAASDGTTSGPWLFALSSTSSRVSLVDAVAKVERGTLAFPGRPLALAARRLADGGARLWAAVDLGRNAAIYVVDVPAVGGDLAALAPKQLIDLGAAEPVALALSPDGATLAIGDHGADERSPDPLLHRSGLRLLELASGSVRAVDVGGPVSELAYGPATRDESGTAITAGRYLFALVDSGRCLDGDRCGGVQVVLDGRVDREADGSVVAPIRVPGVAMGLAVAAPIGEQPNVVLNLPASGGGPIEVPLLLAVPSANGLVYFVDGTHRRVFDIDSTTASAGAPQHIEPDGTASDGPAGAGPVGIEVAEGAVEDETLALTFQGVLPGLAARSGTLQGLRMTLPGLELGGLGVAPGDLAVLSGSCTATASIASAGGDGLLLAEAPSGCSDGAVTVSVRAAGLQPWVVAGTRSGLFGRMAEGERFAARKPYFHRPAGYDPTRPALRFTLPLGDPRRDAGWRVALASGLSPMSCGGGSGTVMPGPATWAPTLRKFYVAYPGVSGAVGGLAEIDPSLISAGSNTNVGLFR